MHTIFLSKRRLHGLPDKNHCCFSLISTDQVNGKTKFLENIFRAFFAYSRLAAVKNLSDITDARESESNAQKFLILLDEMSGAAKSDMAALKSRMTADIINTRPLYSKVNVSYPHNTTYIATANTDNLGEHLIDKSGDRNRRFFPVRMNSFIDIKLPPEQLDEFPNLSLQDRLRGCLYPETFDGTCLLCVALFQYTGRGR